MNYVEKSLRNIENAIRIYNIDTIKVLEEEDGENVWKTTFEEIMAQRNLKPQILEVLSTLKR